ncbi:mutator protein MutT [Nocardia tenerifensis]|uniref:Mutator protein MutT n=1 Tax=Nocardia tenerifensis TaxID=228006 RepID=A0A318JRA5_9NOCA|nr:NUDIX domain-containing protein [Nocardia tenerifensis]PXX57415.1 mutator protein MutT [Nocardia tenerifensis]
MTVFRSVVGVQLLLSRGEQVLLARRRNTRFGDGEWNAPGGRLDEGEDVLTAVLREAEEEIGVLVDRADVEMVASMHVQSPPGQALIIFVFRAETWSGEPWNREPDRCSELRWFDLDDIPEQTILSTRAGIDMFRRGQRFGVFGWPEHAVLGTPHR